MADKFVLNETSYFGKGARENLPEEIKQRGFQKAFVVTDKSLYEVGVSKKVTDVLEQANIPYEIFSDVKPNPTMKNVRDGLASIQAGLGMFNTTSGSYTYSSPYSPYSGY